MTRKIRLIDIAKETGVSVAAVSKILGNNNCTSIGVRPDKAELIRKTAAKYNYIPNIHARALVGQSSKLIGILVDSCQPPVISRLLAELERHIALRGYRVVIAEAHENIEILYENYKVLKQHGVDGIIFMSHDYVGQTARFRELFDGENNIVYQGIPHLDKPYACVNVDFSNGIASAVNYLRQGVRERIGLFLTASPCIVTIGSRIDGYNSAISEERRIIINLAGQIGTLKESAAKAIDEVIIPKKVDALIMQNDLQALMMLGLLAERGIRVPEDIAIIGHDNEPFAEYSRPELSTIDQVTETVAGELVKLLLEVIGLQEELKENRIININPQLICRQST